jgi:regulator of sigma E protease
MMASLLFPSTLRTLGAFVVVLGILVSVHEFGHYLAARWGKVFVEAFSIGFGRKLWSRRDRQGTEWRIGLLPLGGYVKLYGQEPPEEGSGLPSAEAEAKGAFYARPVGVRMVVVAAGPAANFLLAFFLFSGLFATVGKPSVAPVVTQVIPGSPAEKAGLAAGDEILAIGGTPVHDFADIQRAVTPRPDTPLDLEIRRHGATLSLHVTTGSREVRGERVGALGVAGGLMRYRRLGVGQAVAAGAAETWRVGAETLESIWLLLRGEGRRDEIGGPLRIAALSGQVAAAGLAELVSFIAVLSVNLGLINLLPIPVLDGGHLVFYALEALARRPVPKRLQEMGLKAGLLLIISLFIFATWNDLDSLGLFKWLSHLFG